MPTFRDKVEIEDVEVLRDTGKALLCRINEREIWIPQSQIDDDSEVYQEGDSGTLIVSEWIALEKKLV
jgi:hypothetical protein